MLFLVSRVEWQVTTGDIRIAHADATLTFPQTVVLRYTLQD